MKYALFSVPVGTIYDLPQTIKEGEEGLVSTIGDEGLYGQACQVRTAPGGVTAAGVQLPPDVAEVVSFYGYHGYVNQRELQFVREEELWEYLGADLVLVGRATDVLSLPKVQGVRMMELERGGVLRRQPETAEEVEAHKGWAKVLLTDGRTGYVRDVALEPVKYEMTAVFSQREGLAFNDALAETLDTTAESSCRKLWLVGTAAAKMPSAPLSVSRQRSIWVPSTAGAASRAGESTARALSAAPICSVVCSSTATQRSSRAGRCMRWLSRTKSPAMRSSSPAMWRFIWAKGGISTPPVPPSAAVWSSTALSRAIRCIGRIW